MAEFSWPVYYTVSELLHWHVHVSILWKMWSTEGKICRWFQSGIWSKIIVKFMLCLHFFFTEFFNFQLSMYGTYFHISIPFSLNTLKALNVGFMMRLWVEKKYSQFLEALPWHECQELFLWLDWLHPNFKNVFKCYFCLEHCLP